ncbi:MAG: 2-hydroxyacyl-CoA dehydratase [Eubacterium sp.]|nr:2-hydroxyacyl-CoA dehydratase [Eubacterium sp.]
MNDKQERYRKEILSGLDRLWKDNGRIKAFKYFEDLAYRSLVSEIFGEPEPDVVLLGTGIPEVLLRAFPINYRYITGGSHAMTAWSDDLVPRDTDPVSRSILGQIHAPGIMDLSRSLFLIPIQSDSMRKIAFLLKEEGYHTFTLDIPPARDERSVGEWERQLVLMVEAIAGHAHKRISLARIKKAAKTVTGARYHLNRFISDTEDRGQGISGAGKMLIRNSFYYADDLEEWTYHLKVLGWEIEHSASRYRQDVRPGILLTGSPILFPNYKIPFLIEDVGMRIRDFIDPSTVRQEEFLSTKGIHGTKNAMHAIAASSYKYDASPAYTCNEALMTAIHGSIRDGKIEGVIFHILKGQIEYDFELERMTEMFESYDIPVFRLETDFQDQDIEQLRIRLEAFCEMLSQKHCMQGKRIVQAS